MYRKWSTFDSFLHGGDTLVRVGMYSSKVFQLTSRQCYFAALSFSVAPAQYVVYPLLIAVPVIDAKLTIVLNVRTCIQTFRLLSSLSVYPNTSFSLAITSG